MAVTQSQIDALKAQHADTVKGMTPEQEWSFWRKQYFQNDDVRKLISTSNTALTDAANQRQAEAVASGGNIESAFVGGQSGSIVNGQFIVQDGDTIDSIAAETGANPLDIAADNEELIAGTAIDFKNTGSLSAGYIPEGPGDIAPASPVTYPGIGETYGPPAPAKPKSFPTEESKYGPSPVVPKPQMNVPGGQQQALDPSDPFWSGIGLGAGAGDPLGEKLKQVWEALKNGEDVTKVVNENWPQKSPAERFQTTNKILQWLGNFNFYGTGDGAGASFGGAGGGQFADMPQSPEAKRSNWISNLFSPRPSLSEWEGGIAASMQPTGQTLDRSVPDAPGSYIPGSSNLPQETTVDPQGNVVPGYMDSQEAAQRYVTEFGRPDAEDYPSHEEYMIDLENYNEALETAYPGEGRGWGPVGWANYRAGGNINALTDEQISSMFTENEILYMISQGILTIPEGEEDIITVTGPGGVKKPGPAVPKPGKGPASYGYGYSSAPSNNVRRGADLILSSWSV